MGRKMVVAVEHDALQRELFECAFRECEVDFDLRVFNLGADLLEYLSAPSGNGTPARNVSLAIVSLNKFGMQGEDVLEKLRANPETAFLPVAVLGDAFHDDEVKCAFQRGANAYLIKPVKFEDYASALRDTLKFWQHNLSTRPR